MAMWHLLRSGDVSRWDHGSSGSPIVSPRALSPFYQSKYLLSIQSPSIKREHNSSALKHTFIGGPLLEVDSPPDTS
jgi:hypothetical protein